MMASVHELSRTSSLQAVSTRNAPYSLNLFVESNVEVVSSTFSEEKR